MTPGVDLTHDLDGVDWAELKADLAADAFDNGRSAEQLRESFAASGRVVLARVGDRVVGTARALTDGVCNAWIVDVWTATPHRRGGVGAAMVADLVTRLPGQHVGLFTDEHRAFYEASGFTVETVGMSLVSGRWLDGRSEGV